jgi:hypothetical protein
MNRGYDTRNCITECGAGSSTSTPKRSRNAKVIMQFTLLSSDVGSGLNLVDIRMIGVTNVKSIIDTSELMSSLLLSMIILHTEIAANAEPPADTRVKTK